MGKINIQLYSFMDGKHNDSRENLRLAAEIRELKAGGI